MMTRMSRGRAAATLALLVPLMGCQLVKKLTGRGNNDAGARTTTTAPLGNGSGPSPVIALPNPTVAPLPTTPPPVPPPVPDNTADAAVAAATDAAPAAPDAPVVAVVDGGAVPTDLEGGRRGRRGGVDDFCKQHPGRVHPRTHVLCPM
jgi:hypothetical protein